MGAAPSDSLSFRPNSGEQPSIGGIKLSKTYFFEKYHITLLFLKSRAEIYFYLDLHTTLEDYFDFDFTISNNKITFNTTLRFSKTFFLNSVAVPENFIDEDETDEIKVSIVPKTPLSFVEEDVLEDKGTKIILCKTKTIKAENIFESGKVIDVEVGLSAKKLMSLYKDSFKYIPFIVFPGTKVLIPAEDYFIFSNFKILNHKLSLLLLPKSEGVNQQLYLQENSFVGSYSPDSFLPTLSPVFLVDGPDDHSIVNVIPKKMRFQVDNEVSKAEYNTPFNAFLKLVGKDENTLLLVNGKIASEALYPYALKMYRSYIETYQNSDNVPFNNLVGANFVNVALFKVNSLMELKKTFYYNGERYLDVVKRLGITGKYIVTVKESNQRYSIIKETDVISGRHFRIDCLLDDFVLIENSNDANKVLNKTIVIEYAIEDNGLLYSFGFIYLKSDESIINLSLRIVQEIRIEISDNIRLFSKSGKDICTISECSNLLEGIKLFFTKSQERPIIVIHK